MSSRKSSLLGIFLLVLLWIGYTVGLLFFNDALASDHFRASFKAGDSYPTMRVIQPLFMGVGILILWIKTGIKNTGVAWLAFALLVFVTFIYTIATPPQTKDDSIIICNNNQENCHKLQPPP